MDSIDSEFRHQNLASESNLCSALAISWSVWRKIAQLIASALTSYFTKNVDQKTVEKRKEEGGYCVTCTNICTFFYYQYMYTYTSPVHLYSYPPILLQSYTAYCTFPYCTPCNTSHHPVYCICMRSNRILGSHHSMLSHLISVEV